MLCLRTPQGRAERESVNLNGSYDSFLSRKAQLGGDHGFTPEYMPDFLFDFQRQLVEWSAQRGMES
jgi:hypothetical protein